MKLQVLVRAPEESKEVVDRLATLNIEGKLSSYLKKFDKEDAEGLIELNIEKNSRWKFDWALNVKLDWKEFRFDREDYENLDDLVNNLFTHLKEELSDK